MKTPRIHVTDHALVRYLERVRGSDIAALRAEIAARVEVGVDLGASGVRVDGFVYKLRGDTVVTIAPACQPNITNGRAAARQPTPRDEDGGDDPV